MLFSSIPFIYYFLPLVFLIYFLVPRKFKNFTLLVSSLIFYAWGEPKLTAVMLISIATGYASGLILEKHRNTKKGRLILCLSLLIPVAFLVYFKYADFFIDTFNAATGMSVPLLRVALPIGISFYTFQILSYQVDVYRGSAAQRNPIDLACYITLFPQLIAGPIVRYTDIEHKLKARTHTTEQFASGVVKFTVGLGKKILLANTIGSFCTAFDGASEKSVVFAWVNAAAVALQIYFDFSGYSDMAIGLGRMLGFDFLENFNYPFISKSATEFWRRWHMSLGSWFRDYVYIPLGGNRVSPARHIFNIFVVWFLTGFWHGAGWNYIIWGVFYAVILIAEKFLYGKRLEKHPVISHFYVIIITLISFTIFNRENMGEMLSCFRLMLGLDGAPFITAEALYYLKSYAVIITVAAIGSTPVMKRFADKLPERARYVLTPLFIICVFLLSTAYLADGSFNPFLYFRF
ncbi:MAG: MBOAT family protein [Ruminococcaceae bacterium]|nr:MBOAT family protein [Oscillospiraceae bacterium]MBQ9914315.1 MBOAT family protein [Clostridia bacterium]